MNVIVLSDGVVGISSAFIRCTVHSDEPLPAEAYAILGRLAQAVEEANEELLNLVTPDEDDEPDE